MTRRANRVLWALQATILVLPLFLGGRQSVGLVAGWLREEAADSVCDGGCEEVQAEESRSAQRALVARSLNMKPRCGKGRRSLADTRLPDKEQALSAIVPLPCAGGCREEMDHPGNRGRPGRRREGRRTT